MISYVVPVWREAVYTTVAQPWLADQVARFGAQLIEVRDSTSIFAAHEYGRQQASHRFIMYVHDDVRLLAPDDLSVQIQQAFEQFPALGLLGPVGKVERQRVPWWLNRGAYVGHWHRRGKREQLVYQYADQQGCAPFHDVKGDPVADWSRRSQRWDRFAEAGLVDGFYLIEDRERVNVPWDTATYGANWHGYDMDRCCQVQQLGFKVMVPPWLFLHDNAGHAGYKNTDPRLIHARDQAKRIVKSAGDRLWLADLDAVNQLVRRKWRLH